MLARRRHLRYYSASSPIGDGAERKMGGSREEGEERATFGSGHLCIKFPKTQTAERQAETDGLSCGREERKCQNSVREEMEAWRLWSVKRDRSQAESKKGERTCQ